MMWFSVHILFAFKDSAGVNQEIIAEDAIYLMKAESLEEIRRKASDIITRERQNTVSYFHNKKSEVIFSDIRKIVEISNEELGNERPPSDNSELSYELYRFKNKADLEKYIKGESIYADLWNHDQS